MVWLKISMIVTFVTYKHEVTLSYTHYFTSVALFDTLGVRMASLYAAIKKRQSVTWCPNKWHQRVLTRHECDEFAVKRCCPNTTEVNVTCHHVSILPDLTSLKPIGSFWFKWHNMSLVTTGREKDKPVPSKAAKLKQFSDLTLLWVRSD